MGVNAAIVALLLGAAPQAGAAQSCEASCEVERRECRRECRAQHRERPFGYPEDDYGGNAQHMTCAEGCDWRAGDCASVCAAGGAGAHP
jgi:hypothetical protein